MTSSFLNKIRTLTVTKKIKRSQPLRMTGDAIFESVEILVHVAIPAGDACADFAGTHLHIDQEVVKQAVDVSIDQVSCSVTLGDQIRLKRRGAIFANWVNNWRRNPQPVVARVTRLKDTERGRSH